MISLTDSARASAALGVLSGPAEFAEYYSAGAWESAPHLRLISDTIADAVLEERAAIIIIEAPPRHGKSELVSRWLPVWYHSLWPAKAVALTSYAAEVAEAWGRKVRNTHDKLGTIRLAPDSQAAGLWHTEKDGSFVTAGVGGPLTGKNANLLIVDDPIKNAEEADSELLREKLWNWWQTVVWTRRERGTVFVVMHTRWHEDDLVGKLLQREELRPLITRINLPAMTDCDDSSNQAEDKVPTLRMGRSRGEALWASRFPVDGIDGLLMTKAGLENIRWWWALFMQRPTPQEGAEFKREWWRYYKQLPVPQEQLHQIITSWDCAFRDTKSSDFVVGQVWAAYGTYRYLLDQVRGRMDFIATCSALDSLNERWRPTMTLVEAKANGDAVLAAMRGVVPALVAVEPRGSKVARARSVQGLVEGGDVFLPEGRTYSAELVDEAASFPLGKHDDMVDALSQALDRMRPLQKTPASELAETDDRYPIIRSNQRSRLQALIPKHRFG